MNALYWITRFDSICGFSFLLCILSLITLVISTIIYFANNVQSIYDEARGYEKDAKAHKKYANIGLKVLKLDIPLFIIFCILYTFTPTTKEALLIYGVGGTIDYIKENPVAKELPDKCILVLDKWASTLIENNDTTNNN